MPVTTEVRSSPPACFGINKMDTLMKSTGCRFAQQTGSGASSFWKYFNEEKKKSNMKVYSQITSMYSHLNRRPLTLPDKIIIVWQFLAIALGGKWPLSLEQLRCGKTGRVTERQGSGLGNFHGSNALFWPSAPD